MITHRLWKSSFNTDPEILGRTIQLSSKGHTIVGVLPPGFEMANKAQVFVPKTEEGELLTERAAHSYQVVARLRPGKTVEQADAEMTATSAHLENRFHQ